MIQRIQTIYLLLAAIFLAITNIVPLASIQSQVGRIVSISASEANWGSFIFVLLIATSLSGLLSLVAIFLYKTRKKQVLVAYLALFPILLIYGYFVGYAFGSASSLSLHSIVAVKGIVLPLISFVLILLAIRRIKADDKLVRSLDRIR